jgi:sugar transferase (PEP-CTERM/EpsH1 system associated)
MQILFICHRFPHPPDSGGKIRPFNTIKHFSAQGHEVTLASLVRSEGEEQAAAGMREYCAHVLVERVHAAAAAARMLAYLPTPVPSSMGYFYSRRLQARIDAALQQQRFDLIFVHCSSVAPYVAGVRGIPKVLDFTDMDSQKWLLYSQVRRFPMSLGYWIEGVKLRRAEISLARAFDYCTCATRAELETLDSYQTGARSGWFPNGVDTDYFHPVESPYEPETISFTGRMDYYPNERAMVELCEHTLPRLRARRPNVRLLIVGADPSRRVRRLGELPGVTVTGAVPDVRPYVSTSAVSVAPLSIARGTQNKVLEAMAMGVPVVASEQVAGGVDAIPGEHFLVASSPAATADAILRLLDSPAERNRFARAGRARMISHHSWQAAMERLDEQIEGWLPDGKRGR